MDATYTPNGVEGALAGYTPEMSLEELENTLGGISNVHVAFDPRNIRSRFARFDPRLAHLRNLSAGVAPFGLLALQPNEEQY